MLSPCFFPVSPLRFPPEKVILVVRRGLSPLCRCLPHLCKCKEAATSLHCRFLFSGSIIQLSQTGILPSFCVFFVTIFWPHHPLSCNILIIRMFLRWFLFRPFSSYAPSPHDISADIAPLVTTTSHTPSDFDAGYGSLGG